MSTPTRLLALSLVIATAGVCAAGAADDSPRRYDGYQVARVQVEDAATLQMLESLGGDVWSEHPRPGQVDVMFPPGRLVDLDAMGINYRVWIDDVQRLIDQELAVSARAWFDDYHPYDDIVGYLNQLATDYPTLASIVNVGTSLEGRTIWGLRIAGPAQDPLSPAVFYFAGLHAREWIGPTVPQYLATHLLANYGTDPNIAALVDGVEWYLVPCGNPDGYVYSWGPDRMWRKNRRDNGNGNFGVDINRNFSYAWGLNGSSSLPSSATYRGPEPFSEPETQALRDFILAHPNIRAMNDLHSYSQLILWPWGYTPDLPPDNPSFQILGQAMHDLILGVHGVQYDFGPTYSTIYAVSGGSVDWAYGERSIWAFSFELRDTGTYGFILPANQIIPNNQEVLPALLHLTASPQVRSTQFSFPEGRPDLLVAGEDTAIQVAITSAVETLNPASATLHYRYDPAGSFVAAPLAQVSQSLFSAVLPATNCASAPEYYFSVTGTTGQTTSPPDAPASTYAASMISGRVILDQNLSTDPGWLTEGLWAWGRPMGLGGTHGFRDPNSGHTGLNVYGYNLQGDYPNLLNPPQNLTSLPFDCTGQAGLRLSFWRWLGVETAPWDRAMVLVSNDGTNWTTVWQNVGEVADNSWVYQDFDIAAVADDQPTVYLRWVMGPTDSGWTYCGWNIDDIQVYATGCVGLEGDYNGDRRLDYTDFAAIDGCWAGPDVLSPPGCSVFDFARTGYPSGDGDVDLADAAGFQVSYTGP